MCVDVYMRERMSESEREKERKRERTRAREVLLTIKKRLKVGKHNALSGGSGTSSLIREIPHL